jgi:CheY-like chemotaxis protein
MNREELEGLTKPELIDLVFSDIVMPGGSDGFEPSNQERRRWPAVRVLLTSGFVGDHVSRQSVGSQRAPQLLGKPYDLNQLAHAMSEALHTNNTDFDQ